MLLRSIKQWSGKFFSGCRLRMLGLPAHGGGDPGTSAGMIEEDELLNGARIELTMLSRRQTTLASPSGSRAALRPYMSASNSMLREIVLVTGVG